MWKTLENLFSPRRHPFDWPAARAEAVMARLQVIKKRETLVDSLSIIGCEMAAARG